MRHACFAFLWLSVAFPNCLALADNSAVLDFTNVLQLRRLARTKSFVSCPLRLEGDALWSNSAAGKFALQDTSGTALLEMDLAGQTVLTGRRVRLTGNGTIVQNGGSVHLGVRGAMVDNDGVQGGGKAEDPGNLAPPGQQGHGRQDT